MKAFTDINNNNNHHNHNNHHHNRNGTITYSPVVLQLWSRIWVAALFSLAQLRSRGGSRRQSLPKSVPLSSLRLLTTATLILLCTAVGQVRSYKSFYIYWNTTNPIFRSGDSQDHVIGVNEGNAKFDYDQVNFFCPVYSATPGFDDYSASSSSTGGGGNMNNNNNFEKYIIYNVSREEYEMCRITNPSPRIIAVCDKPNKLMFYTITFRPFTPQPGGLEFPAGRDYYFISTSSREDLHRRVGGRCSSHNMKVVFRVCCDNDNSVGAAGSTPPQSGNIGPTSGGGSGAAAGRNNGTRIWSSPGQSTNVYRNRPAAELTQPPPIYKTSWRPGGGVGGASTKKWPEYHRHPNDIAQNDELFRRGSANRLRTTMRLHNIYYTFVAIFSYSLVAFLLR